MLYHSGQRREQKTVCLCEICNSEQPSTITDRGLVISRSATRVCSNKCAATGTVRFGTKRPQYMFGTGKMLQNGQIAGHASTYRNGRCGTCKEEVAGSNPASPTFRTRARIGVLWQTERAGIRIRALLLRPYCNPNEVRSGSRHGSQACSQRVEGGILRDLQTRAKASGLLSASARSTRLWFRTSANRAIRVTLIGSRRMWL